MRPLRIVGISVFLRRRKTRTLVGELRKIDQKFVFTYENSYLNASNSIALGPEFPLTQKEFSSDKLFLSLEDRIPSIRNPAYPEYCLAMGVDPNENDPFILLSTIGSRGPSSFLFYPMYERNITPKEIVKFRKMLGLTTREFASVFEFSQNSLNSLERGRRPGIEILKRLEILLHFPTVALYFLLINSGNITYEKWVAASEKLTKLAHTEP